MWEQTNGRDVWFQDCVEKAGAHVDIGIVNEVAVKIKDEDRIGDADSALDS